MGKEVRGGVLFKDLLFAPCPHHKSKKNLSLRVALPRLFKRKKDYERSLICGVYHYHPLTRGSANYTGVINAPTVNVVNSPS